MTATASATPQPSPTTAAAALDVRLLNGAAELHLDGRVVPPGRITVGPGEHHVAALVEGEVAAEERPVVAAGQTVVVELVVPPPLPGLAVVVENSDEARPQSGLHQADVVYEALAEGGIPRFLAVFLTRDAAVLGPVRSLRHYFAFMAAEYEADLVHIGASPQGFAWRDALRLGKLDESAGDPGVWRIPSRAAPHNAYTATAADRRFLADRGRQRGRSWGPLRFETGTTMPVADVTAAPASSLSLTFRPSPYTVGYAWDAATGRYPRTMAGAPHRDAETSERIAPTSVVVQFAQVDPIPGDAAGRVDIALSEAAGRLLVFDSGRVREGTWSKGPPFAPTDWRDAADQPITLPPGPVWVEVVPLGAAVSWEP